MVAIDAADMSLRITIPLGAILDEAALEVALLSPAPTAPAAQIMRAREIGVAATIVIELENPAQYLSSGDLLFITGLGLPATAAEINLYVAELKAAKIAGLVFGVEPVHQRVPPALLAACREHELPLLEVPPHIYFSPIFAWINRALEAERTRALSLMVSTARRLAEAALQRRPLPRMIAILAQATGGWAVLQQREITLSAGPAPAAQDIAELFTEITGRLAARRKTRGHLPTAFATYTANGILSEVTANEIRQPRTHSGAEICAVLALGKAGRLSRLDRTVLLLTANLASLVLEQPETQSMAVDQLLMHCLTNTAIHGRNERFSRLLANSLGTKSRIIHAVIAAPLNDESPAANPDVAWLRRLLRTPFVEHRSRQLRAFVSAPPGADELAQAAEHGWVLALSSPYNFTALADAMSEAEELGRAARRLRRHVLYTDADQGWSLAELADPALSSCTARNWLAPLDSPEFSADRAALKTWLAHHGSWDRTARALDWHRNTVRRLVKRGAEQLHVDLADPVARARLVLAFAAADS